MWLIVLLLFSVVFIIISTSVLKWHPFLALLIAAFGYGVFSHTLTLEQTVSAVNTGFGHTIGYIGIVIVAGSIIGKFLEMSGGAHALAMGALRLVGKKRIPLAMSAVGTVVSIPVFCDAAFVVLSPLARALTRETKGTLATAAIALSLGLIVTHSIMPPTPGPVAAAGILKADLGMVILLGLPVGLAGLLSGWLFSVRIASKTMIEPLQSKDSTGNAADPAHAPSLWKSLLPIFIPILLIVSKSVSALPGHPFGAGPVLKLFDFIGQPSVALLLGVFLAFLLPAKLTRDMLSTKGWLGQGIVTAATIIVITGSGGAFGQVLKESGIGDVIQQNLSGAKSLGIFLPVVIAAALKTAQGSGTVAIITAASLMAPLLGSLGMDSSAFRALVVLAIGCGAMIVSHANDSYFWVVTQMSDMTVNQGYRLQTFGTLVVGISTALVVWLLSLWLI